MRPDGDDAPRVTYPRSGTVVRLLSDEQPQIDVLANGVPVHAPQRFIALDPAAPVFDDDEEGCVERFRGVIVSMVVAEYLRAEHERDSSSVRPVWREVYVADTGADGALRNENGVIVGTRRLVRYV